MSETTSLRSFGYEQELKRSLGLGDLIIYGLVFMVPIAPFAIFGVVFNGSKGMVPLTYIIGLVAMLFTALSYREMSRAFPIAGSVYSYAGRGINHNVGFLAGWAILLDYLLVPTLLYVTAAVALASFVPGVPQWLWIVAFVLFNTVVNYLGIESTARLNRLFLLAELIVLAVFVAFGVAAVIAAKNGAHFTFRPFLAPDLVTPGLIFGALSIAVLSFLGFDAISTLSEEVKGGDRRLVGRASLVNFGALFAFLLLHISVFVHFVLRNRSRRWHLHLVTPAFGFVIIGYVLYNADARAKIGGGIWLIIGVALLVFYRLTGRGTDLSLEE